MNVIASVTCVAMLLGASMATANGQSASSAPPAASPLPPGIPSMAQKLPDPAPPHPAPSSSRHRRQAAALAAIKGPYPAPDDASLVVYDYDPDYSYPVLVRTSQETHLVFGPDEEVVGVYLSDTGKRWLEHTALTKRDVFIEARLPGLENAATIITSRRRYELDLRSSDDGKAYHRVSWHYLGADAQTTVGEVSPFGIEYPGNAPTSNAAARPDRATPEGQPASDTAGPDGPHIALDHANFDYRVEGKAPFAPVIVFDDGRFTYLQLPHQAELPAILLMDDKGEAEIASFVPLGNDFYEVQQTVPYGLLLKRGKEEVRIFNGQGKGCGLFGCDSARMTNVYGKP
ncbi:type IV secretion system protein VirB9 [Paraburkholderia sp. BL23I1N1]|uniref:TrbG/VirB9 family P-type conjugative transfer protein n=1 Tax=unclassified Paraburkholderia TaxID=2615204 RepID=UPI000E223637|nr:MULTISPECIES: TrbG/VirB9 family P-type conjugative transfer protein [unclassified Paraburkholderia]REE18622.1 type IV secretion system protein VirB9 [Paraburkholderia sp. BL27I4N3]RKE35636.1 type IV secretion system protein VirB9 [Paraburkholderia sp. BL23I1N1]TCK94701.1 type IV secretion system protein VirB9 [Paraburkholderia sp. BL9I2N2]